MIKIKTVVYNSKRFKVLKWILRLIFLPLSLPLSLMCKIGELSEFLYDKSEDLYNFTVGITVKILKWEQKIK